MSPGVLGLALGAPGAQAPAPPETAGVPPQGLDHSAGAAWRDFSGARSGAAPQAPARGRPLASGAIAPSPAERDWQHRANGLRSIAPQAANLPFPRIQPYKVTGPQVIPQGRFVDGQSPAHRYVVNVGGRNISVLAPKTLNHRNGVFHNVEQVAKALAILPAASRALIREVRINPERSANDAYFAREYNNPEHRSYMTAGATGTVDIYPTETPAGQVYLNRTLIHESGHTLSFRRWGHDLNSRPWRAWRAAGQADGVVPSDYARTSPAEDLSETLEIYALVRNRPEEARFREMMPGRFALLDRLVGHD